jgi:hypothetical protein
MPSEINNFSGLMLVPGSIFLYEAFAHPLTADAGQILIGSVCLAFCFSCGLLPECRQPAQIPNLCAGNRGQILFFQNAPVMQFMPGGDVCQRAYRDFVLVRDAAALPGVGAQP